MTLKIFRRGSARCIGLFSAFLAIVICLYYISKGQPNVINLAGPNSSAQHKPNESNGKQKHVPPHPQKIVASYTFTDRQNFSVLRKKSSIPWGYKCYSLDEQESNITAIDEFSRFDFQPEWVQTKEFWDKSFEERYKQQKKNEFLQPLKVIIVPHSHNDPGWLKTFVNYFQTDSRKILNLIVTKMQEYTDMTFIWSEISFLQLWWDQAHPSKQRALRQLIQSGRFEITTGGWVMTDEANVHLFPMLDQLIEGHQWLRAHLNVTPEVGWSIDPFGHGSTVPYLLAESEFEGTVIQRIHYAWKQWFAKHLYGDFIWVPYWKLTKKNVKINQIPQHSLLTHNMPFDIYSIKHSCGPHPFVCLNFDFRKIPGEYTEYSMKAQFITEENVKEKAQLLMEQYSRTASLFPHNVALIPLGDDFRYNKEREVDQQYSNYKKLIDHINAHKNIYNIDIAFGTPRDYFREIRKRSHGFPTFKGDFFVYSDVFSDGRPAYWSGYFTTRPFYKILSTDLEHNLRGAEILFSIAYNTARQLKRENAIRVFEKNYEKIILARRNLGLFQHHDAITGTSKAAVMRDYGLRLFESIQGVVKMQEYAIEFLVQNGTQNHNFLLSEWERDSYSKLPQKASIFLGENNEASFVVFNSLAQTRLEVLNLRTAKPNLKILNEKNVAVPMQVIPVWNINDSYGHTNSLHSERIIISTKQFEIQFLTTLEPLSLTTFKIVSDNDYKIQMASIYCDECYDRNQRNDFNVKMKPVGDIQLENNKMRLLFDEKSGFLKSITRRNTGRAMQCAIKFAAYKSAQFHSGAYLFKTDPEQNEVEKNILEQYEDVRIIISTGPLSSDVTAIYGQFLAHTTRIFNTQTHIDSSIYIENYIDFEIPPKNRETELFMRFLTNIENGGKKPEFFSDQNGFQFHRRVKIPAIGIEGNYYPITSGAFIQDNEVRLTLLTSHAQGAASFEPGQFEVMLDRRTLYDDYRGMGEGIVDSGLTRHKFWILIEKMPIKKKKKYEVLSSLSNYFSNGLRYPPNIYFVENLDIRAEENFQSKAALISHSFPCDLHLLNLRTLSDEQLPLFPSKATLMILHRQGYDCSVGIHENSMSCHDFPTANDALAEITINMLRIDSIERTSITGVRVKHKLKSFSNISLDPMDIKTFILSFSG